MGIEVAEDQTVALAEQVQAVELAIGMVVAGRAAELLAALRMVGQELAHSPAEIQDLPVRLGLDLPVAAGRQQAGVAAELELAAALVQVLQEPEELEPAGRPALPVLLAADWPAKSEAPSGQLRL